MESCWLCPAKFDKKRDLKNHLATSLHNILRVVCVWCPGETWFRRAVDLKAHALRHHPGQLKDTPEDFLGEPNCFWFAQSKEDYKKIVSPTSWDGTPAVRARVAVLEWLKKRGSRGKEEQKKWVKAWSEAHPRPGCAQSTLDARQGETLESEVNFVPDYEEIHLEEPEQKRSRLEEYDPERPKFPPFEVSLKAISLQSGDVWAIYAKGCVWYKVTIAPAILKDLRATAALTRRMSVLQEETLPAGTWSELKDVATRAKVRKAVREDLSLSSAYLQTVYRQLVTVSGPVPSAPPVPQARQSREPSPPAPMKSPVQASVPSPSPTLTPEPAALPLLDPVPSFEDRRTVIATTRADETEEPEGCHQARELLRKGCMPLFPPARRDWRGTSVLLPGNIRWPPQEWEKLPTDNRLLLWEFTAMTLEARQSSTYPTMDRTDLLDKYNFLALPGTQVPEKNDKPVIRKARYYNYETLRLMSTKSKDLDSSEELFLRMMTCAASTRDKSTDYILDVLDAAKIPLRMEI